LLLYRGRELPFTPYDREGVVFTRNKSSVYAGLSERESAITKRPVKQFV
jgi:hypothetical protein